MTQPMLQARDSIVRMIAGARHRLRSLRGPSRAYEPAVQRMLSTLVGRGDVCLDVGANHGALTELLARRVGSSGHVTAFEPQPARTVTRRARPWRESNAHEAVSDGASPVATLFAGRARSDSEWNIVGHDVEGRPAAAKLEVPAVSLDDALPAGSRGEFHDAEAWEARWNLFEARYRLYDLDGVEIPAGSDRVYQCLALPEERRLPLARRRGRVAG